jgi:hypothetical protein
MKILSLDTSNHLRTYSRFTIPEQFPDPTGGEVGLVYTTLLEVVENFMRLAAESLFLTSFFITFKL